MFRFLVIAFFAVASAEVVVDGPCPDVKPMENFRFADYLGSWYEVAKFPNVGEVGNKGKCSTAEYTAKGDEGTVRNSHIVDGTKSYVDGGFSSAGPGKVMISYKFGAFTKKSVLTILDTDYTNYAIGYSCRYLEKENKHQVFSWIMSRNKSLGESKAKVDSFLAGIPTVINPVNYVFNDFSDDACKFTSTEALNQNYRRKN